ncbi:hypothetical protein SAMN02745127_00737 [Oceanospirillum multiglobuliferum]|uniref:Uncharacterized protein n=1 Tax=Oceanospirillum multiglobuliferum TaxID=64969 RepID=A0A1T4MAY7_9GAMM|nr:hypothetical protein [Oceanospirillum multiglobuliferum]OPX56174.1 hypothetical protein BTE48_04135 [Oceanospirillum multiglobuliferum]SJZ63928.1 hypothetical protein SAMN02745127_00737 [Oceanospirillum multiglobuliferum]
MLFLVTTLLAFTLIVISLFLTSFSHPPKFHNERSDFIQLIEQTLTGQAEYEQWSAVIHIPIRHDPALESIRIRCIEIERLFYLGREASLGHADKMFSALGLRKLEDILLELQDVTQFNPE